MSSNESNVRVVIRIRPMSPKDRLSNARACLTVMDGVSIICPPDKTFSYDSVFEQTSSQTALFEGTVAPFIYDFLQGFNCSVLAYGQTGSGKTYTMGTMSATDGIIPRTINRIVKGIKEDKRVETADIYISFAEIYNEEVNDLLDPRTGKKIGIREDTTGDIVLTGVKEERIPIIGESDETPIRAILNLLHQGALGRTTKSTAMNLQSSRSHAIFTLTLRQTRGQSQLVSKLNFVDLAGSERLKRTGAEGERAKESISINSGLLALGNVISALSDPNKRNLHIPYRDSKLTRLLQDSLGGNSKTIMIACVSPADIDLNETINTLRYAQRARNIKNKAQINMELPGSTATMFEVLQLRRQVAALKAELLHVRGGNDSELQRLERENTDLRRKSGSLPSIPINIPRISEQKMVIRQGFESIDAIATQISSLHLNLQDEDDASNVRIRCEDLLSQLRSELTTQEETLAKLQALSHEYNIMRDRFEERLLLQQEALTAAQRERDEALSRLSDPTPQDNLSRMTRQKYEDKIKRMGMELNDTKKQLLEVQEKVTTRSSTNEKSVHNLKQTVQTLRSEKQQFQDRIDELLRLLKQGESARDGDLRESRLKERKASDLAKRWKRTYEFQKSLLLKRSEQCSIARNKVQTLLTILRRKSLKSPSISRMIDLNSPSWRRLMASDADIPGRFDDRPNSPTKKSINDEFTDDEEEVDEDVPMTFVSSTEIVESKPAPLIPKHNAFLSKLQ